MLEQHNVNIFLSISKTWGSGPLFCTLSNRQNYYCKKNNKITIPFTDLINEVLINRLLSIWNLKTPEICLVNLDFNVFQREIDAAFNKISEEAKARNITLRNHYVQNRFNHPIFGSKYFINSTGLSGNATKGSFKLDEFTNPIDILLIGFFDLWTSNKDRKPTNSNLIKNLNEHKKLDIVVIDNCQAFNNSTDYLDLLAKTPFLSADESILTCGFAQQVVDTMDKRGIDEMIDLAVSLIEKSLPLLNTIFDEIPESWGLSLDNRTQIMDLLSNKDRVRQITQLFKSYVNYEELL